MSDSRDETFDLTCSKCQYMLRGLDPAGVCPECGQPILESIEFEIRRREALNPVLRPPPPPPPPHPPLGESRPWYLRCVAGGIFLLLLVHVAVAVYAEIRTRVPWWEFNPEPIFFAAGIGYCIATALITLPEPREKRERARWLVMWVATLAFGVGIVVAAWGVARADEVPVQESGEIISQSNTLALSLIPSTWLFYSRLVYLMTGLPSKNWAMWARAARNAATLAAVLVWMRWPAGWNPWWGAAWQVWNPYANLDPCYGIAFPIAFILPPAVLLSIGFRLIRSARQAGQESADETAEEPESPDLTRDAVD